jgi:ribosome-binding protein aMBF1 (putative translation factor)
MATSNDPNTKQLEELVSCIICLDNYKDPRILPCSHTFCFGCIQQLVKNDKFTCPLRDGMEIKQTDISKLPINRIAKDMVEFVLNMNIYTDKKTARSCDNCSEDPAVNWCDKCAYYYCVSCSKSVHSLKALQSHIMVPLSEKIESFCTDHPDEKFKYWCSQCEVLVCRDCLLFEHKEHKFSPLKDAATEAKTKFQQAIQEADEIKQNLTKFLTATKGIINQQREIAHQQRQDIEQTFAALQHILEERKRIILQQLEDSELQTMKMLDQQQNTIDQHLSFTTVQELCIKKMLISNEPMQILKFRSTLSRNHEDFREQYKKIDKGYTISRHTFEKDDEDFQQISQKIAKLGSIINSSYEVGKYGIQLRTSSLDISRSTGTTGIIDNNYPRGYKFSLKKPLKLQSIQVQSNYVGQLIGFAVNDAGIVIQKTTVNCTDASMKWLTVPLECDIKDNYAVFVVPSLANGSYTYKKGDTQQRMVNQNCSVESKSTGRVSEINIDSQMTIDANIYSIDMLLDIEE